MVTYNIFKKIRILEIMEANRVILIAYNRSHFFLTCVKPLSTMNIKMLLSISK